MDLEHLKKITTEQMERLEAERLAGMPDPRMLSDYNKLTNMAFWWPRILHTPVPKPETELIPVSYLDFTNAWAALEEGNQCEYEGIMEPIWDKCLRFMMRQTTSTMFLRSFFHSAKHEVHTTKITKAAEIPRQVMDIMEATMLKDIPFEGIACREFMFLDAPFKAFNGLPVAKERRVIVESTEEHLSCGVYPYWPIRAISSYHGHTHPLPPGWQERMAQMNAISDLERDTLTHHAMVLYKELMFDHPNWTFDFVQTKSGQWYFIDAAVLEQSWRPDKEEEEHGAEASWGRTP